MDDPLYDRDFDALPAPDRSRARPDAPRKKPDKARPKPAVGKPGGRPTLGDRLAVLSLTDTIGIGIYLGYFASVVIVTAIRPSLAVAAVGVGFLVAVPLGWAMRHTLARWLDKAGIACRNVSGWAWTVSRPAVTSRPVRLATLGALSIASPLLLTAVCLFVAMYAGRSLERLGDRQGFGFPIMVAQFAFIAFMANMSPRAKGASPRRGKIAGGRSGGVKDKEIDAVETEWAFLLFASVLSLTASIVVLDRVVPSFAATARAIPRLLPATAFGITSVLGLGALGGYVGAVWLVFLLSREWRKPLGADGVGKAISPGPADRVAGKA